MTSSSPRARRRTSPLTWIGVLLLALGLACFGWIGYQYIGTDVVSKQAFQDQRRELDERWQKSAPTDAKAKEKRIPGQAMGLLRIPDFGDDYVVPILAGTDADTLAKGVGWYENSAAPGEKGNFALAGHRITHGEPFAKLLELNRGAKISIETREATYTYRLLTAPRELTVSDADTWVLDADPMQRSNKATKRFLTLTTCQDLFHSPDRSIAFGELVETVKK